MSKTRQLQQIFKTYSEMFQMHTYNTRSAAAGNFYIMHSRLELQKSPFSRFGARPWNSIPSNLKELNNKNFKKQIHKMLIEILENEDQYLDPESIVKRNKAFANFSYDFLIVFSFLLFDTDII